jgi:hypothetical protein
MTTAVGPDVVDDGLVLSLDAANVDILPRLKAGGFSWLKDHKIIIRTINKFKRLKCHKIF